MIRHAIANDFDNIIRIYAIAREYMKKNGNETQWGDNYPPQNIIKEDINKKQLYVLERESEIHGVFAFIIGDDPDYAYIENGSWLNNNPYGAVHRVASDGKIRGFLKECMDYCKTKINNIKIDTHEDNKIMQTLLLKNGFKKCGIIYIEDGSERIAYQYAKDY